MKVEMVMPQMGESIVEGTVVSWLKKPGDAVKRDEDILTISTDKVDADIPSPAEGVLAEVLVPVGTTVEVGTVVAYIETEGAAVSPGGNGKEASGPTAAPATAIAKPAPSGDAPSRAPVSKPALSSAPTAQVASASKNGNGTPSVDELRRVRSTPLVRRIAREHGISDLSVVSGSGIGGRVTKNDILTFIEVRAEAPGASTSEHAARQVGGAAPTLARPAARPDPAPAAEAPRVYVQADDRTEPMSRMRKSIAEHMLMSRRVSANAQSVWECDWSKVVEARKLLKPRFAQQGVKLTYTAFMVEAAVAALQAHPIVNSALDGDNIIYRGQINVGVAVAIEEGLIVPVIKNAPDLSLLGMARTIADLGTRSKTKKLKPDEVAGGTFTISNPGVFGSLFGIPIISQPQLAILGVGAIKPRVVAGDDYSIRVAPMNTMCLTFDHRVIDGAAADAFMNTFVDFLQTYTLPDA